MRLFITAILVFVISFSSFGFDEIKLKKVKEEVSVVNVEVPVRVFYKGKPVNNLKKEDFVLYEGGKRVDINGFYIIRKGLKTEEIKIKSGITGILGNILQGFCLNMEFQQ